MIQLEIADNAGMSRLCKEGLTELAYIKLQKKGGAIRNLSMLYLDFILILTQCFYAFT